MTSAAPCIIALLSLLGSPAAAQEEVSGDEGRRVFQAATEAYEVGQYQAALDLFREAYDISERPQLLFNIAMAAEHLRRDEEALVAYRAFLDSNHDSVAERRRAIEARIGVLEAAVSAEGSSGSVVEDEPPPQDPEQHSALPVWVLTGVSGAALVTGAVLTALGLSARSSIENADDGAAWDQGAYDRSQWMPPVGLGTLIAGAVGVTIALVLFIME